MARHTRSSSTGELGGYIDNGYGVVSFYPKGDKTMVRTQS